MKNIMNTQEIIKIVDKIRSYNQSECISFDKIFSKFKELEKNYITNNFNSFVSIENSFFDKFDIIKSRHYNNEVILTSNVNKYIKTSRIVENLFDDIK